MNMVNNKPLTYMMGNTMTLIKSKIISRFKTEEIQLTLDHYVMLQLIEKKEDITQQDLANHFHRDKSIILRQMNYLINNRYVARIQDENDKRKKNLILTKVGFDELEKARKAANDISNELLEGVVATRLTEGTDRQEMIILELGRKPRGTFKKTLS